MLLSKSEKLLKTKAPRHRQPLFAASFFLFFVCLFVCLFLFCFCFVFQDRVSLCNPDCPGTHFVDQAGFELTEICLPQPPDAGITPSVGSHSLLDSGFSLLCLQTLHNSIKITSPYLTSYFIPILYENGY